METHPNLLNTALYQDLSQLAKDHKRTYKNNAPFPFIVFQDFFDPVFLDKVLAEFPNLSGKKQTMSFANTNERKTITKGESLFGEFTKMLVHYLNSEDMLDFLQELTGIERQLIPDPYFVGGGFHETKRGGYLKIHVDFNKNINTNLDRRVNLLVFLNKDWEEAYGGHFELWDRDMKNCVQKILPAFNSVVVFSTTDYSYHGHPEPLSCPEHRTRQSLAMYYYSNGRPDSEINPRLEVHNTVFAARNGVRNDVSKWKDTVRLYVPPILLRVFNRF